MERTMANNKYDVIIAGGGTAGVSCAWNCAKRGLKTLIVEKNSFLGGSITSSLVIPAMKTSENAINTDFFDELYKKLESLDGAITYSDGNKGWFHPAFIVLFTSLTSASNRYAQTKCNIRITLLDRYPLGSLLR